MVKCLRSLFFLVAFCGSVSSGLIGLVRTADAAPAADTAAADEPAETATVTLSPQEIFTTGLLPGDLPAFHDAANRGFTVAKLLDTPPLDLHGLRLDLDNPIYLPDGRTLAWQRIKPTDGTFVFKAGEVSRQRLLAVFLQAGRFQKATLQVTGAHPLRVYLDGEKVDLKETPGDASAANDQSTASAETVSRGELTLPIGKHLLLVHAVYDPAKEQAWRIGLQIEMAAAANTTTPLALTTAADRAVDIQTVLDAPRIGDVQISPDGKLVAVSLSEYGPGGERESWLEIRSTEDGALQRSWRGGWEASAFRWGPRGERISYTTGKEGKTTLWLRDIATGEVQPLLRDVEHMGSYRWAPSGQFIAYTVRVEAEKDERKVKRLAGPADRQSWWRDRSYLMQVSVPGGVTRRLTAGPLSPNGWRIAPDSRRLLFFLGEPDLTRRPYSTSELWELDLATLAATRLLNDPWIHGAEYGPDPEQLLLQGSPSAFDGLGRNLPEGVTANDYGGQLYLFDRKSGEPTVITKEFAPAVGQAVWSLKDGQIYALCTDTQFRTLHRYDRKKREWQRIDTGTAFTNAFDLARDSHTAVTYGSGAALPNLLFAVDLKKNRSRLLLDPGADAYRQVVFGDVRPWVATLPDGEKLDGRIYFPPDFDPDRTYPVIVYYYGGTSPVTVDFGGRYPKNVWAGQGYLVYVPEPSGATGYGQEFAARHVNDWGRRTAWEVIEATKVFLTSHAYADPEAVGCIGASYGGFLTEYIITQTDLFAAAVSHAGISSISSYWGEGLWGYAYGARALAGTFPWQDRDIYVEQSPLFHAEKIHTPLLLVHGDSDVNVPVGESDQLFTALKLLGREVEYVQIQGQDHHILDHDQRIVWNDAILAFFARFLQTQPEWWDHLFPDPGLSRVENE